MRKFSYLAILLFVTALYGEINYESARQERRLKATRTTDRITVDGRLEETAWEQSPVASGFIQNEPRPDEPASEKTEVRVLYDNENLYIGVYAYDSEPNRLIVTDLTKDFSKDTGDSVEIILDTFRDERNGYRFATNPAGAKWDAQMTNEGRETNDSWDGVWHVETRTLEDGWIAEMAIPFKTLKFREQDAQTWGINFQRNLRRRNEDSFWSPLPRIYSLDRVSLAGTLEDLEGIRPGANIRVKPYVVGSFGQFAGGDKDYTGDIGIDAKYGLTTGLTWDFTFNTDFSQVEADEQQINLTRFNLFFPEKREFFLENSGIFQFGDNRDRMAGGGGAAGGRQNTLANDMIMFFSRRIGLSDSGTAIPILGGTRLTGRVGTYELGLLNIQQRESGDIDATNFTVARLRRNLLGNSDIGVMLVNKDVQDSAHFNRVLGADANFRFGQSLSMNSFLAKSFTRDGGEADVTGRVSAGYETADWSVRGSYMTIQEDFVNEMGFVPRVGVQKVSGYAGMRYRPESLRRFIRQINPHFQFDYLMDKDGNLQIRHLDYHVPFNFQNSSFVEMGVNPTREQFSAPFVINRNRNIAIPAGVYSFDEYFILARSDASRRISGNIRYALGPFYTGYKHTYGLGGTFRFNYKLTSSFSYTHNNINLPEGHFKTNLLTTRFNYSFSTAMFLNALVQYNNDARQWSSNVRFNLIHRPLSDIFLVYNERRNSEGGDLIDRAVIAKVTYMIAR
jgi:hypothetical protein